jgi:hypothetical protein
MFAVKSPTGLDPPGASSRAGGAGDSGRLLDERDRDRERFKNSGRDDELSIFIEGFSGRRFKARSKANKGKQRGHP